MYLKPTTDIIHIIIIIHTLEWECKLNWLYHTIINILLVLLFIHFIIYLFHLLIKHSKYCSLTLTLYTFCSVMLAMLRFARFAPYSLQDCTMHCNCEQYNQRQFLFSYELLRFSFFVNNLLIFFLLRRLQFCCYTVFNQQCLMKFFSLIQEKSICGFHLCFLAKLLKKRCFLH